MSNSHAWKVRVLAALMLLLTACWSKRADAADFSWIGNDGNWSDPVRLVPFGVPSPADVARLGNLPGTEDSIVTLDQNDTVSGLVITELMRLDTTETQWS